MFQKQGNFTFRAKSENFDEDEKAKLQLLMIQEQIAAQKEHVQRQVE